VLLIVTNSNDATVDFALPAIAARGIEHRRLNTDEYPGQVGIFAGSTTSRLALQDGPVDLEALSAIWWRRPTPPRIDGREPAVARWAESEARAALDGLWPAAETTRWVNHPERNRRGQDKIRSLRLAARLGLRSPEWIVTNEPTAAKKFADEHPGGIIAKAIVAGRIDDCRTLWSTAIEDLSALEAIGPEPSFLQRLVAKRHDVRVTVIGEHAFPVRIDASHDPDGAVDWRRSEPTNVIYQPSSITPTIEHGCLQMMRELGLQFATFDFAVDHASEYHYLEINPNGQWAWIERETGLPLAEHLAALLDA
jgi:glutathione synthase/RimK-type ligase-like ATP-grasp enzyme